MKRIALFLATNIAVLIVLSIVLSILAQIVFGILASAIVMYFSRLREFRADAGGASLAGREKMIAALKRLQSMHEPSAFVAAN